jgi:hypothetical protein
MRAFIKLCILGVFALSASLSGMSVASAVEDDLKVTPATARNVVLSSHTVTAHPTGKPILLVLLVEFNIISGPNQGLGSGPLDADGGDVSWTYVGGPRPGTDTIEVCFGFIRGEETNPGAAQFDEVLDCDTVHADWVRGGYPGTVNGRDIAEANRARANAAAPAITAPSTGTGPVSITPPSTGDAGLR